METSFDSPYNTKGSDGRFTRGAIICREELGYCAHGIDRSSDLCVKCDESEYPL